MFIGAIMSVFIGVVAPYGMIMIRATAWGAHASQLGGIFLFFIFTMIINTLLGFIRRPLALNRAELVLIYIMMLVALTVPTQNLLVYIIPTICVPFYSASAENDCRSGWHRRISTRSVIFTKVCPQVNRFRGRRGRPPSWSGFPSSWRSAS